MNLRPWQSFRVMLDRSPAAVMRDLDEVIPPSGSWFADSYFFGTIDVDQRTFALYRNGLPKFRVMAPIVRGSVKPGRAGTTLEISMGPGLGFWLSVAAPLAAVVLMLITLIAHGPAVVFWLLSGFIWLTFTGCFSGLALLAYYLNLRRCRAELMRLLSVDSNSSGTQTEL